MIKPVLPPCSVAGCGRAAGAIINEALLCGEHASIALERVLKERGAPLHSGHTDKKDEQP